MLQSCEKTMPWEGRLKEPQSSIWGEGLQESDCMGGQLLLGHPRGRKNKGPEAERDEQCSYHSRLGKPEATALPPPMLVQAPT